MLALAHPDPDFVGIIKLNEAEFVLVKFYLHPNQVDVVRHLEVATQLVACFQTKSSRIRLLQSSIIFSKLKVVKFDITLKFLCQVLIRSETAALLT